MRGKWFKFLGLCFFLNHIFTMSGDFFQTTKKDKFSLYPFLTFFGTRVLETHLGGLRQPVLVLPYPNSVQVLGMEQPNHESVYRTALATPGLL